MDSLPRPEVILTHESDLDGFVAGHLLQRLARKLFGAEVRLEAWNTQAWRQRAPREKSAWVCDFTFESRLDRPDWLVIDHHPALVQPAHARLIHDSNQCAASICYALCRENGLQSAALDKLVGLTDVGDLFREEHPDFSESQDYAALLKTYPFWNLSRLVGGELEALIDHPLLQVVRVRREVEDPLGYEWSRSRVVSLGGGVGWVDVVVGNSNLIVHRMLREPGCPYRVLLTLSRKASTGVVVSLRSLNGEALPIARRLQGGGHPNAAGATLPRGVQGIAEAVDYLRSILDPKPVVARPLEDAFTGLSLG